MRNGWSLYHYEGQWHRHEFQEADLSDTKLTLEITIEDGDTVTVTASSRDGVRYQGDYRYREGSYSNGEVLFERFKGPAGDVLVGEWREAGGPKGDWIIKLHTG